MAFNKQNFISTTNKSPTERLVDESAFITVGGQRQNVSGILTDTANQLLLNGSSIENIRQGISSQASAVTSGAEELYFALAGLQISRTGGQNLKDIRRSSRQSSDEYFVQSNPTTRISRKRRERNIEIISAI